jgi:hypothetical protein
MESKQHISELTPEDLQRLAKQRGLIEAYLADESRDNYETAVGKLGLLRALLEGNIFEPTQTWELQSMGIVLGDALVQELGLRWVIVEDEYGRDPALAVPGKAALLFPLTMISKRVEAGKRSTSSISSTGRQRRSKMAREYAVEPCVERDGRLRDRGLTP